jgi:hypothetical protein
VALDPENINDTFHTAIVNCIKDAVKTLEEQGASSKIKTTKKKQRELLALVHSTSVKLEEDVTASLYPKKKARTEQEEVPDLFAEELEVLHTSYKKGYKLGACFVDLVERKRSALDQQLKAPTAVGVMWKCAEDTSTLGLCVHCFRYVPHYTLCTPHLYIMYVPFIHYVCLIYTLYIMYVSFIHYVCLIYTLYIMYVSFIHYVFTLGIRPSSSRM